jgi:hypothetical protein
MTYGLYLMSRDDRLLFSIGSVFLAFDSLFLLGRAGLAKPIHIKWPTWHAKSFFSGVSILLCIGLVYVLLMQLSEEHLIQLFTKWYFIRMLWLLGLSNLAKRLIVEKTQNLHVV